MSAECPQLFADSPRAPRNHVKVSAKTEYACIAMLELAACSDRGEPIRIRAIADAHGVPSRFLVQILLQLKGAGLVMSTRGAAGGYQLARDADEITLADICAITEGAPEDFKSSAAPDSPLARVLSDSWNDAAEAQRAVLSGTTLADLLDRVREQTGSMYYI